MSVDPNACADAYRALRERVTVLVRDADPDALDAVAPATPDWRVRDVLAHMTGVNADILTGTLDGVASDAWTATQVDARRAWSVDQILDEWAERGAAVEGIAPNLGPAVGQWLYDATTHEHDIRNALGAPGARDTDAVTLSFIWATDMLDRTLAGAATDGLTLHTDGEAKDIGAAPRTGVHTSKFEVVRAMTGRRSRAQIEAYAWDGAPRPEAMVLGIFTVRPDDFVE